MSSVVATTIVVVVALALVVAVALPALRRARLRRRFGAEYERTVAAHGGDRRSAERDLRDRLHRYGERPVRSLPDERAERYRARWAVLQERFVDEPAASLHSAQELLGRLMQERGYPTDVPENAMAALSVHHADVLGDYRAAREVALRSAAERSATEEMREALVRTRRLFEVLLTERGSTPAARPAPAGRPRGEEPVSRADAGGQRHGTLFGAAGRHFRQAGHHPR
ncbi:hypothetical protein [Allostreptomyces psammosilenae]|uniref:Secreted protein n=1 Tax=Allostreptomyces psammosilenae TaxID=1892865 RepID=A0A852ZRT2_9ACTN|nr:hypothetical protein [Allostreptomyces psammosilenae]NYI04505.1 hypothetical protein [Allostreptomyces psammosilenae]